MILGFKDQFVPFVEDGSKTHTIRAGERWKAGMRADLFARPRQRDMRLLFRAPVVRVEEIEIIIRENAPRLTIAGERLNLDEADAFFWRDGFRGPEPSPRLHGALWRDYPHLSQAMAFWVDRNKLLRKPFHGQIIHWDYEQRFMDVPKKRKQRYCESMMCSQYGEPVGRRHSCAP